MSIPNAPDDSKAHPHAEGAPRAGEHRVAAPTSETRSFSPVCLSCGFPRKGLGDAIVNCPECGLAWARARDRHPWASELDWGLKLIFCGVGAGLLAEALEVAFGQSGGFGGTRVLSARGSPWIVLPIVACIWLGSRALRRALAGRAAAVAALVLGAMLALLCLTTTSVTDGIESLVYLLAEAKQLDSGRVLYPISDGAGAVAPAALLAAMAAGAQRLGFGDRARRAAVLAWWGAGLALLAIAATSAFELLFGSKVWTDDERRLMDFYYRALNSLHTLKNTSLALLWLGVWLGALVLRRQLASARDA